MAIRIPEASQKLFVEQGLVPARCRSMELVLPASGAMLLRYEIYVTAEHLDALAVVFQMLASEAKSDQDGPK